jgi:glycosyltransferase involved in cell wall biosynthesis
MSLDWLLAPQLRAFADAGYEVFGASAPGPHLAALEAAGVHHVPIPHLSRSVHPVSDARALIELAQVFRRLEPTIVHSHNPKPGVLGPCAARLTGVPIVVNTLHGLYALPSDSKKRRWISYGAERVTGFLVDVELVQSPEDVVTLERLGIPKRKVVYLGNGIDLERFDPASAPAVRRRVRRELGLSEDTIVCGVVGRLVWEKGYREVFAAARALRDDVTFVVVGPDDPDKADAVSRTAITQAERDGVIFLGSRADIEQLYAAFDLYVLASYREGFPRSAMEAAAMGLPLVVTDVRGCRQVVDPGVNGLMVPMRDCEALTRAICELARDDDLRLKLGRGARMKAEREFDQRRIIDITLRTYDRLLARRSAAAS